MTRSAGTPKESISSDAILFCVTLQHCIQQHRSSLCTLFYRGELRLTVRMSVFGRNKNHSGRNHISAELCIVSGSGINSLIGVSKLFYGFFHISYQLFVKVNSVTSPRRLILHPAACHFFWYIFNDFHHLLDDLRVFMSCIQ